MVSFGKLGSWFLLLIISYTLVTLVDRPRPRRGDAARSHVFLRPRGSPAAG